MNKGTTLSNTLELAKEKIRYDNACKRLLSEKVILAWIMQSTMDEYREISIQDIAEQYISGTPIISAIPVAQDEVATASRVTSEGAEDVTINEGTVTYDIRFRAIAPTSGEVIGLIINIEAQNDFYPGYPLVKRGIYYCSRLISAQQGTEFMGDYYEDIKKVYSVWICTNPPKYRENTITQYHMTEKNMVGKVIENRANYDLLTTMMICLGNSKSIENDLLRLLDVLLKDQVSVEEKKQRLEEEFHIPMEYEMERKMNIMCNLSDGIEQRGIERGLLMDRIDLMIKKMQKGKILEKIADEVECEPEDIYELYQVIEKCGVGCAVTEILEALEEKKVELISYRLHATNTV